MNIPIYYWKDITFHSNLAFISGEYYGTKDDLYLDLESEKIIIRVGELDD